MTERSSYRQQLMASPRRHVLPVPATASELDEQLREIVPHVPWCRWQTHPYREGTLPLAVTEVKRCTCTAVYQRQHLRSLLAGAVTRRLPSDLIQALFAEASRSRR